MLLTNLLISSLDYSIIEKRRINSSNLLTPSFIQEVIDLESIENDLKSTNTFLVDFISVSSIYDFISERLKEEFERNNISSNVYKTSFDLISLLPESILLKLDKDNFYPTNYGTFVFDWEDANSNDEFSLEIGNNCFGYFSELNGKDTVNVEEVIFTTEEVNILHKRIEDFYQR